MTPNRRTVLKGIGAGTALLAAPVGASSAEEDEAGLRVVHASPDAPAVDVTVDDDGLTLFEDVAFGESSGYATVPAGEYDVEIRPAGGDAEVFGVDGVSFAAGSTYTAFAVGYLSPDDESADEAFGLALQEDKSAPLRGDGRGPGDGDDRGPADGNGRGPRNGNGGGPGNGRGPRN